MKHTTRKERDMKAADRLESGADWLVLLQLMSGELLVVMAITIVRRVMTGEAARLRRKHTAQG